MNRRTQLVWIFFFLSPLLLFPRTLPQELTTILDNYGYETRESDADYAEVLFEAGCEAEIYGDYESAFLLYRTTADFSRGNLRDESLFRSWLLACQMGQLDSIRDDLDDFYYSATDIRFYLKAILIDVFISLEEGLYSRVESLIELVLAELEGSQFSASSLYALGNAARQIGDDSLASDCDSLLIRLYPDSPESNLLSSEITLYPAPLLFHSED